VWQAWKHEEKATTAALLEEMETRRTASIEKHAEDIKNLHQQLAIEKESWEEMFMRKQQNVLKEKAKPNATLSPVPPCPRLVGSACALPVPGTYLTGRTPHRPRQRN
jgi:hypothetical protein